MSKNQNGILVTFEGTEGSGKSTLIQATSLALEKLGYPVTCTREPGGSPVAEKIRDLLLQMPMDSWTELFLYEAARAEHLAQTLRPALSKGHIVLCDRFIHSTLAYQAYARKLPWPQVKALNRIATQGLRPQLTVFLDIDPEVGLRRVRDPNRFEAEGLEFQKLVRKGFIKARAEDPKRWFTLKYQNRSPDQLAQCVINELNQRFKSRLSLMREPDA